MFYLMAAFIAVWVGVTVYVVYINSRQRHLEQELETLEELVQAQQK